MNDQLKTADGSSITKESEEETISGYLFQLRKALDADVELAQAVAACSPAIEAKPRLIESVEFVRPGTEHLLDKAACRLLDELEIQRKLKPSLYLVSTKTGQAIMPINESSVFTPPPFMGLDGKMHDSRPVVHPGITSSLAIAAHEAAKEEAIIALSGGELAFAHMSDPDRIIAMAKQKLSGSVSFGDVTGEWEKIEIGKENAAGMEQSVNRSFHRIELFSSILAKKIVDRCGGRKCQIGNIVVNRGAKHRWYVVQVKFDRLDIS